jgi:hypothetical protein
LTISFRCSDARVEIVTAVADAEVLVDGAVAAAPHPAASMLVSAAAPTRREPVERIDANPTSRF